MASNNNTQNYIINNGFNETINEEDLFNSADNYEDRKTNTTNSIIRIRAKENLNEQL